MDKKEILKITKNLPDIIGIAPNAFSRTVLADFFPNYSIVCFKYRGETDQIAKDIKVYCVEKEDPDIYVEKLNAGEILNIESVKKYISSKNDPHLLIYKPGGNIETVSMKMGWKIIGNSATVKYDIENKLAFRNLLHKCGLESITGETVLFDLLNEEGYKRFIEKYGPKIVFQVTEMTSGGGTGTAFINSIDDFRVFMDKFKKKKELIPTIEHVNVTKFIEGIPTSISACATKYGVITGSIQTQILDIADVRSLKDGSGLFCGHDFSYGNYDKNLNDQAKDIANKFGNYIYKNLGYKGIFGLDLITDIQEGKVYPVECNPRYTDAFPLVSQMHIKNGAIPMDVFHVFEHMNIDYKLDAHEVSESYIKSDASQIILETKTDDTTKVTGEIKAGIYKINNSSNLHDTHLKYSRGGYRFENIHDSDELLLTEGVPFKNAVIKEGGRIFRLIFQRSILEKPGEIRDDIKALIKDIYENISLEKTLPDVSVKDFLGLKVAEAYDDMQLKGRKSIDADIVNFVKLKGDIGLIRPEKIGWSIAIKESDALSLIKSKKLRQHIKNWVINMNKNDLDYEVKDTLTSNDFALWYAKYLELMSSKEKANIKINSNWLTYKEKLGKKVSAVFIYKDKRFIGGNLIVRKDNKFTVVYGIVEKIKTPNWSMGAIVDYLSVDYAKKLGYKKVGFGQDNNLYGYHLSKGLLQYKLNFGLSPSIKEKTQIYATKILRSDKLTNGIMFFGLKGKDKVIYVLNKGAIKEPVLNTDLPVIYCKI